MQKSIGGCSYSQKYDLGELFSSKTISPNRQQKLHRTCSKTTRLMFWSSQIDTHLNPMNESKN